MINFIRRWWCKPPADIISEVDALQRRVAKLEALVMRLSAALRQYEGDGR